MGNGEREGGGVLRRRWLFAGAVLVVTILCHDLAMTTDAHVDAESTHETQSAHARHAPAPTHVDGAHAAGLHAPFEEPSDDCSVGIAGVLAFGGTRVPIALDMPPGNPDASTSVHVSHPAFDPGTAPQLPPGVRRALLQVYLI